MTKNCIVYIPYKLEENGRGARMVRPLKMIQAFRDLGYSVTLVDGFSRERKKRISFVKKQIRTGISYDFAYIEGNTEPIFLTDPHHFPTHPFLDFGFFRFLNKHDIPIGLFYCDIYWKFKNYGEGMPLWKRKAALFFYALELKKYENCISKFYLPDCKMLEFIGNPRLERIAEELPPGCDKIEVSHDDNDVLFSDEKPIKVFYVGGLGDHYQIVELVKAIKERSFTRLTLCCRADDWEKQRSAFEEYLCDRVEVIHCNSDQLDCFYKDTDICSLMFKESVYISFARPVKAYEYLAHEIPVIATEGISIGDFVKENKIGWSIPYDYRSISEVFDKIKDNPSILKEKIKRCHSVKKYNLWTCRANSVITGLNKKAKS